MSRTMPDRSLLAVVCTAISCSSLAQTGSITRSDSIDLLHTRIELDLTQTGAGLIQGVATLRFTPRLDGIAQLPLDLLALTVDSVIMDGLPLAFTHVGELLMIDLAGSHGPGDTLSLDVHYHGDPVVDASGWGGFYTLSSYQYDLGVAFDAIPHSFGRSWFPCFDNFVERTTFEFLVRVDNDRSVVANGSLVEEIDLGGGEHLYHWSIAEPIPSYLASVAATDYATVRDTFPSITGGMVPVTLVARPPDTTHMKSSFVHLRNAFDSFESRFGPYRWERVGYCLTSQGAMEHPTNICYPASIVDGSLTYEETMAHELAHHWFGDLITCRRAEEMYINEGFAEYLSYLFVEDLYGRARYDRTVRENHHDMVAHAHLKDEGWYALADVPQAFTYGEHSYRKGADVIHTLRSYLGDSLFSVGFTRVLANNAFSDMSTLELRDSLTAATGQDLTNFFADWVLQPGWATFEVDSMNTSANGGGWNSTVHLQQKIRHADHLYEEVPLTVTFEGPQGQRWTDSIPTLVGGTFPTITSEPPFEPVFAFVNADERLALGTTTAEDTLDQNTTLSFPLADVSIIASGISSPSPLRVEEFWSAADEDTAEPFAFVVSPDRWWRITGRPDPGAQMSLRVTIDGRPTSSTSYDPGLVMNAGGAVFSEDSLVVLYRPDPHFPWAVHPDTDINTLGTDHGDGRARVTANNVALGDFVIGWRKSPVGIRPPGDVLHGWRYYPNPSDGLLTIEAPAAAQGPGVMLSVLDAQARTLVELPVSGDRMTIDTRHMSPQHVFIYATIPGMGRVMVGRATIAR